MKQDDTSSTVSSSHDSPSGRRRFLGAGSAIAPAVLTLVSRPALGGTCFPPSRALSVNASHGSNDYECNGESPGNYWQQTDPNSPAYHWPSYPLPSTPFASVFDACTVTGFPAGKTMVEVLGWHQGGGDPENVAFHLIAAYLNVVNGYVPSEVVSLTQIKTWFCQWQASGYATVQVGTETWTGGELVSYLQSNTIAP